MLITTHMMLGHGMNLNWANVGFETLPFKAQIPINQSSGRLRRPEICDKCFEPKFDMHDNKRMKIIGIVDDWEPFASWWRTDVSTVYQGSGGTACCQKSTESSLRPTNPKSHWSYLMTWRLAAIAIRN